MRLLSYLPQQRIIGLRWLVAISFIPGLLDFVSIAIIGRLTGSLVGGRLGNLVPGIKVFGGNQFEQALWLIGLFVFIIWIQSLARIFLRVMQERTASAMWLDLSQRIFEGIIDQPYEFHITNNVSKLSEEFEKNSMKLGVIIEVNVGMDRCGVELDEIVDFAKNINDKQGLDFEGIMGYEGHTVNIGNFEDRVNETTKAMNKLIKAKDILEENNISVKIVSASGTGTYNITSKIPGITELQCGSYIFMDGNYLKVFDDFQPALSLLCTVVSRRDNRIVIDCGLKSVSMDQGLPEVVYPRGIKLVSLSEEHCKCELEDDIDIQVGDKVFVRPMHSDTTINLHDNYFVHRDGIFDEKVEIAGRGKFK